MIRVATKRTTSLNSAVGLDEDLKTTLSDVSNRLADICAQLGGHIEQQVTNPEYVDGKDVAADRLLDWTADLFAISEDIKYYINPQPEKE